MFWAVPILNMTKKLNRKDLIPARQGDVWVEEANGAKLGVKTITFRAFGKVDEIWSMNYEL